MVHSAGRLRAFTCRSLRSRSRFANSRHRSGGRLVERESRGFLLTPLGRDAHEQTLRILDETLLLETMGKRFEEGPLRVAVGIVSTLAPYLVPGILERLQTSSPRVELDVLEAPGQELVSGLLAGRLDAAIVSLPLGILELPERELFEDCFLLAGRTERLAAIRRALGDELRPADLARADIGPLLTLGNGHCFADQVLGASLMWRMQEVHRGTESLATLSRLVASGAGLALLPEPRRFASMRRHRACASCASRRPSPRGESAWPIVLPPTGNCGSICSPKRRRARAETLCVGRTRRFAPDRPLPGRDPSPEPRGFRRNRTDPTALNGWRAPERLASRLALMALQEDERVCLRRVYCHDLVEAALHENLEDVIGQGTEGESYVAV